MGQPTYETLAKVHLKLNTNAASIHLNLGNRQLCFLFLTIIPSIYNTQSKIVFVPPTNPGPSFIIPQVLMGAHIADICRKYDVKSALYTKYNITDKSLMSLFIAAVDKTYIRPLRDKYIGYSNITTKEMLAHLYLASEKILDGYLEDNDKWMRANYDINQPMEVLIEKMDNSVDITAAAKIRIWRSKWSLPPIILSSKPACSSTNAKCGVAATQPIRPGQI